VALEPPRKQRKVSMSALKGVPMSISPELLEVLARMGHGDHIVLADGNFPGENQGADYVIRADGMGVPDLLRDILRLMPVDTADESAFVMAVPEGDPEPPVWSEYRRILSEGEGRDVELIEVERFAFYDFTKQKAFAVVMTGETALYANLILVKGVVTP
jgi:L-fucose mutarotase